jgi:flagellin FlaA/flagellin FlaB
MELKMPHKREKGQVGIGTLIVFIAMVLVAAIAAGVLINTAGFLQSQSEQTGEESSAQVTNQIEIASKTGVVAGTGSTNTIAFNTTGGGTFAIDSGSSVTVALTPNGGQDEVNLQASLAIQDGDTLTFTQASASSVDIQNERTGATTTVNTGAAALSISGGGGEVVRLERTVNDPATGEYTLQTAQMENGGTDNDIPLYIDNNGEQYLAVQGSSGNNATISDGDLLNVATSGALTAGGETISTNQGDSILFEIIASDEVRLTNQRTGSTITFNPFDSTLTSADSPVLETDSGTTLALNLQGLKSGALANYVPGGTPFLLVNDNYDSGGGGVSEIQLVAIKGSGADQINLEETTITTVGPDGTNTLTYSADGATEDQTFSVEAIQDEDDSVPVMTDTDRFRIVINPGTLETGETMTLQATTGAGATTEILVSVPNTLSGKTAVQV